MEEILLGVIGGVVIVAVATKSKVARGAAKKLIKVGYGAAAAVSSGSTSAFESAKDLMAESKAEFEAAQAAKAEVAQ